MDYSDAPQVLRDFLIYHETICGHSKATVDQYYLDLRMFLCKENARIPQGRRL